MMDPHALCDMKIKALESQLLRVYTGSGPNSEEAAENAIEQSEERDHWRDYLKEDRSSDMHCRMHD